MKRTADYQGWSNRETWHVSLMADNEYETYKELRDLFERGMTVEQLRDFLIVNVVAPYNKQQIADAQEWNDIPMDERIDHSYEDLKEKSPQAADIADQLGFGEDVEDYTPETIDPELVNWQEIWDHLYEEVEENLRYEREAEQAREQGIGWATRGGDDMDKLRDAIYRHHGALPEEELDEKSWNHPQAYHNRNVTLTPEEFLQTNPRWDNHIDRETRLKIWALQNEMFPDVRMPHERDQLLNWDDPRVRAILEQDPNYQKIMSEGHTQRLHDYADDLQWAITHNTPHPHKDLVSEMLRNRGYTPEQITQITRPRWRWQPNPQYQQPDASYETRTNPGDWISLDPKMDQAQVDKTLDQPGDLTLPEHWGVSLKDYGTCPYCQINDTKLRKFVRYPQHWFECLKCGKKYDPMVDPDFFIGQPVRLIKDMPPHLGEVGRGSTGTVKKMTQNPSNGLWSYQVSFPLATPIQSAPDALGLEWSPETSFFPQLSQEQIDMINRGEASLPHPQAGSTEYVNWFSPKDLEATTPDMAPDQNPELDQPGDMTLPEHGHQAGHGRNDEA